MEITVRKPMELRQMYLMFLVEIYEEFDDDLLQDALELLLGGEDG